MQRIQLNDWIIEVDEKETKRYYNHYKIEDDCSCSYCDNYRASCKFLSPALKQFFSQFGIDPRKEGEFMDLDTGDDSCRHVQGMYHFVGNFISGPESLEENWNQINLIEIDNYQFGFNRKIHC